MCDHCAKNRPCKSPYNASAKNYKIYTNCNIEELNQAGTPVLPYPLQRRLVRNLAIPAEAAGRSDLLPLWAGQSANLSTCTDVLAFLTALVKKVSEIAEPLIQWSAASRENQSLK